MTAHPLAAWIEHAFGLAEVDGRLERRLPRKFVDGVAELAGESGAAASECETALQAVLEAGSQAEIRPATPVLAFRLHQFLASGASFYATLEPSDRRHLSAEPGFSLGADGEDRTRLLFPLAFCRECGQELYLAARSPDGRGGKLLPRTPQLNAPEEEIPGTPGYVTLETGDLWSEDEDLPDGWYEWRKAGPRVKNDYRPYVPERMWVAADGTIAAAPSAGAVEAWWQPRPLMICPRCRASYELRQKSDFGKLVTLSQTGRSTATTILACAAVDGLGEAGVDREVRKLLSFTDNRQDAALQAGHLNDFVLVIQLRGALVQALSTYGSLTFDRLGAALFDALALPPTAWMKTPVDSGPGYERARSAMVDLLDYLALEDLGRAWRVAQPNLEQCGLLRIDYDGLDELAADSGRWFGVPQLEAMSATDRSRVLRAILDHLRGALAIEADMLEREHARSAQAPRGGRDRRPVAFRRERAAAARRRGVAPGRRRRPARRHRTRPWRPLRRRALPAVAAHLADRARSARRRGRAHRAWHRRAIARSSPGGGPARHGEFVVYA